MQEWFDIGSKIDSLATEAAERAGLDMDIFAPDPRPADPRFGDLQLNGALPYAKRIKANPREVAMKLVEQLEATGAQAWMKRRCIS